MRTPTAAEFDRRYTGAEYLDLIDELDGKYSLRDGRLVDHRAMAGASDAHALITANLARELGNALKGSPCRVYSSDLIIRIPRTTTYNFGDATVICGPVEFDPADRSRNKAILNPRLIVEVASPTSRAFDHVEKFAEYQSIDSFEEYVLVEQDEPYIQTRRRQPDGTWIMAFHRGLKARVPLTSIDATVSLAEIYAGVTF